MNRYVRVQPQLLLILNVLLKVEKQRLKDQQLKMVLPKRNKHLNRLNLLKKKFRKLEKIKVNYRLTSVKCLKWTKSFIVVMAKITYLRFLNKHNSKQTTLIYLHLEDLQPHILLTLKNWFKIITQIVKIKILLN